MPQHPRPVMPPLLLIVLLVLTGCGHAPSKPKVPEVVYVKVPQYVTLPTELTAPCPPQHAAERRVGAVVAAYNANIATQTDCDKRMGEIRKLQPAGGSP